MEFQQPLLVGIRFSVVGKVYHFDATRIPNVEIGDSIVVETSRGWQLGQVAQILDQTKIPSTPDGGWKMVDRLATPRDLLMRQSWQSREIDVVSVCRARSKELRLEGVKIIAAEYSFDGTRLAIMFSTETEDKVDLKSLRSEMQKMYAPAQVEMRQIGPRDVAKILGGMGACGLEQRCCSKFLTDFSSISIRMAKEQGISLTPAEITGMCGRLRCCLIYEYDQYVTARASLPKKNKRVITPQGEGRVVDVYPIKESVMVEIPEVGYREFPNADIKPADEYEAFQKKATEPCGGPDGAGCDCGKHGEGLSDKAAAELNGAQTVSTDPLDQVKKSQPAKDDRRENRRPENHSNEQRQSGSQRPQQNRPGGRPGQPGQNNPKGRDRDRGPRRTDQRGDQGSGEENQR
jgi:cell fate regulator YaaT (PSP1 superfamily)